MEYHPKDELAISFLKVFSRYLKNRGSKKTTSLFNDWLSFPGIKHKNLSSSLFFIANLERRWHEEIGLTDKDIRKGSYILYPIFCRQGGDLKILLYYHESWTIYLIPTRKPKANSDDLSVFRSIHFKNGFNENSHIEELKNECIIKDIPARTEMKPSPSRGIMTLHDYDVHFYSLTEKGTLNIETNDTNWRWFSLAECENLEHVKLEEPEKSYQYGKGGIFPNNLNILKFVFIKAQELISGNHLKVYNL